MSEKSLIHRKLEFLPIDAIQPDPEQPRKHFDDQALQELVVSVKEHGILQPLLVRKDGDQVILVAGERRLRAAKAAGLAEVPTLAIKGKHTEVALIENLLREDLTAVEEAEAIDRMMKEHNYELDQLTGILGKAKSTISEILSLTRLPPEVRDECRQDPKVPRHILVEVAKQKQARSMVRLFTQYKERGLTRNELRKITRPHRSKANIAISETRRFREKISKWMAADLEAADRKALRAELEKLKSEIEKALAG